MKPSAIPTGILRRRAGSLARALMLFSGVLLAAAWARGADTPKLSGIVFTVGPDQTQMVWPNARITLKNKETQNAVSTISGALGEYSFVGVDPGEYELTVALAGFDTEVRAVTVGPKANIRLDVQLRPQKRAEHVEVTGEAADAGLQQPEPVLATTMLKSLPLVNEDFQDALPLLPGVVRGPDGLLNIKGGRTNQSGTLVNSTNVLDPVTGQAAISLPLEAVGSTRVLSNPFSAEYGRFAGGVVELETRSGTDDWKFSLTNFFPRFRKVDGSIVGVRAITPRLSFAGPLAKGKLYMFQSFEYRFVRTKVPSLPELRNSEVLETFDAYTQFDWNISANHLLTGTLSIYPQNLSFVGLNTFNPEEVTPNFRQRGYFLAVRERAIFSGGGYLESAFSAKRFDAHVFPARLLAGELDLFPEQNFGTYYHRQDRESRLYQWAQTYHLRPLNARGSHLVQLGYLYAHSDYTGTVSNLPVVVVRTDGTTSQRISYAVPGSLSAAKNELAFFVQERWQLHPQFTLDAGVRFDRDSLSKHPLDVAPRMGFVFNPTRDTRTLVRGGLGLFYDKLPLNVATFLAYPAQTVTRFDAAGLTVVGGPLTFAHTIATPDGGLRVPYSLAWNLQVDREIRPRLLFRFGYEQRETHRDVIVNPVELPGAAELRLLNSGRQSYRELQWTLRWQAAERTTLFFSFVRSRARGDLNSFDLYFGNYPSPIIRPNQRGRLPYDSPNRFLFWGSVGLPWKLELSPVLEVRNGFPFSAVDNELNFIGERNAAGRFPAFFAWDFALARPFRIPFWGRKYRVTAGVRVFNLTDHDNPRDVQQNIFSPNFGRFFNSIDRQVRMKLEFGF